MFGGSGGGGGVYWGRKESSYKGIVVLCAWVSVEESQLASFIDLYSSLGWNSLISHADFLSAFYPERSLSLALCLLNELVEELSIKPCPVVFVATSAGSKACLYKVLQMIQGSCEGHIGPEESLLVRGCLCGQIYDSSPVDFTADLGTRFALGPKMDGLVKLASWVAKGIAYGLDGLYLTRFESQCAEYWQSLYSSVDLTVPFLLLCSENDEFAPYQSVSNFGRCLQKLGGDVKLVKLDGSPHIGHYNHHPMQYRMAVASLLEEASLLYPQRMREGGGMDCMTDEISELVCDLQQAAVNSNRCLRRVRIDDQLVSDYNNVAELSSSKDEQKERSFSIPNPPSINAHTVLGQILFDACVPKNVEGWDIRFSGSSNEKALFPSRKSSSSQSVRRSRRSRL